MLASMALIVQKQSLPSQVKGIPLGLRLETGPMTLRGFGETEFESLAELLKQGMHISQNLL